VQSLAASPKRGLGMALCSAGLVDEAEATLAYITALQVGTITAPEGRQGSHARRQGEGWAVCACTLPACVTRAVWV
jgi:hypothetical protein